VRSDTDPIRELAGFHDEFAKPEGVYFAGNSLGLMPRAVESAVKRLLEEWKQHGVEAWMDCRWLDLAERLSLALAPLVGAAPDELIVTGTTTVNLHQLLATFYHPRANKRKILIDHHAFPSDRYAVASHLRFRGGDPGSDLIVIWPRDGQIFSPGELAEKLSTDVAVAVLPSVIFTTGQLLPIAELVDAAEQKEVLLILDCSHSIGCVPHNFHHDRVPLAFWCSYKYLNGGPGAVGVFHGRPITCTDTSDGACQVVASDLQAGVVGVAKQIGSGHVLVWSDEWVTYTSQWGATNTHGADCTGHTAGEIYDVPQFWYNVIRWVLPDASCFHIADPIIIP